MVGGSWQGKIERVRTSYPGGIDAHVRREDNNLTLTDVVKQRNILTDDHLTCINDLSSLTVCLNLLM